MKRKVGTVSRGLRAPIISDGDDLVQIVVDTVLRVAESGEFIVKDKDIVAVTESILARSQSNYASIDNIATDLKEKMKSDHIGVIFPILSRNRFAICLRGFARGAKKITLMLSYPADEVGNHLVDIEQLDAKNVNPYTDVLTQEQFESMFGLSKHTFTGLDYVNYYKEIIESEGCEAEIIFSNNPRTIIEYSKSVLTCDIHTRKRTKRILKEAGATVVLGMDDILAESISGSGFNPQYGLLGCNKSTEEIVKLFPRDSDVFVNAVQEKLIKATGKNVEVMVYGDGAFKDPVGKIWELADPVVSPGYTKGLEGTPNELKIKYLADDKFSHLKGEDLEKAINESIKNKTIEETTSMMAQGTTPRRLTDLIGSLCDLTSGSGDKGTPIIYIQGYFDNYTE